MKKLISIILAASMAGCATYNGGASYQPVVDTKGVDLNKYYQDVAECQTYARQVMGAGEVAAAGAVVGALFGLAMAAADGGRNKGRWASVGAVSGLASGAGQGETNQREVIRRCLAGRGYNVLS